ncbi:trigger factor [Nannocystis bainbridge]|uniref:Trigger factor n=1 Tax=Nannocystis bainbridge TaxID=2995303 RepID=A0ABT5E7I9_9BACT|nr:trigger factor [Nannocystis bainbridge]MDC0721838.1 trigger factor [Nannocystis bainbridge]
MESQIEKISAVECRVRVQIPWTEISPRFATKLRDLQGKARLPGFRPGKVPPHMLERMFGKSVREELARELVDETFQAAVTQHSKVPLTQPVLEEGTLVKDETFKYAARFEVPPEITPKDYTGIAVRRRPAVADAAKIDAELKAKQEELTELRPLAEGSERTATQPGDVWTVDLDGHIGPQKIARKDLRVDIGETENEYIPGLAAALASTTLDQVGKTQVVRFSPTQERLKQELRGHEAVLTIGFRDLREKHVPALDDDFARDTGEADSLDALKAKFSERLLEEDKNEAERDARKRLVEVLLERNTFEVAPSLVAREVAAQVDLFKRQVQQQGLTLQRLGVTEQQLSSQYRPQALFNVKAFLLLDAIGKAENIVVAEDEVEAELKEMAAERNQNIDRLRATMEKNNQLLLLRAQLREEKILDFLMGKAEVTEAPDPSPEAPATSESSGETAAT